jgi:hypothetical protein
MTKQALLYYVHRNIPFHIIGFIFKKSNNLDKISFIKSKF